MKKFLSIALILALAVGTVFAGKSSGSAELGFGFDLDKMEYGFENTAVAKFSGSFVFDTSDLSTGSKGEKDLHAEIEAKFGAQIKWSEGGINFDDVTAKITKANILYKDLLTVGLLKAGGGFDYAKSYRTDDGGNPKYDFVKDVKGVPGFTVGYKGIGTLGIGFTGSNKVDGKADTKDAMALLANFETAQFKFVEDQLKLQVAAAFLMDKEEAVKDNMEIDANLKFGFSNDTLSADAAVDFKYNLKAADFASGADIEAAANFAFGPVALNAYYEMANKKLDVQVVGDVKVNDDVTIKATGYGVELLNDDIKAGLDVTASVSKFTFGLGAGYAIRKNTMDASASVKYDDPALLTASASVGLGFDFNKDAEVLPKLGVEASVSSKALIDNAEVGLTYKGANFGKKDAAMGKITAYTKVSF